MLRAVAGGIHDDVVARRRQCAVRLPRQARAAQHGARLQRQVAGVESSLLRRPGHRFPYGPDARMVEPVACDRKGWVSDAAPDCRWPAARRAGGRAVRALQCAAAAQDRGDRDRRGTRRAGGGEAARRRGAAGGAAQCGVRRGTRSRRCDAGQRGIFAPSGTLVGRGSAGVLPDRRRGRAGRAGDRARRLRAVAGAADLAALPRPRHAGRTDLSRAIDRRGASVPSSAHGAP